MEVGASGEINGKPIVQTPDGKLKVSSGNADETMYISRNQRALDPASRSNKPTLIHDEAVEYGQDVYKGQKRSRYPNDTLANSHAEVAFMQNAYDSGVLKAGDTLTLPVVGKKICIHCLKHLAWIAEKINLKLMKIIDKSTGFIYYLEPGMKSLQLR